MKAQQTGSTSPGSPVSPVPEMAGLSISRSPPPRPTPPPRPAALSKPTVPAKPTRPVVQDDSEEEEEEDDDPFADKNELETPHVEKGEARW
jgi:LAS seventeen-binding protein 5